MSAFALNLIISGIDITYWDTYWEVPLQYVCDAPDIIIIDNKK